ncbi:Unknown protein, partial [Striga hermonthica]
QAAAHRWFTIHGFVSRHPCPNDPLFLAAARPPSIKNLVTTTIYFCLSCTGKEERNMKQNLVELKGFHNHALTVYPEDHRQISRLNDSSKEIIRDMSDAQAKPAAILAAIQEKNPVDNATCQQVYNYKAQLAKRPSGGRDVAGQLLHLATGSNYIVYTDVDPNTKALTRVFMSHPRAASLLRTYYWYVDIDSTYKTNT